ncbi:tyrosine-type recombinase/integrase [Shewanella bicestrii]
MTFNNPHYPPSYQPLVEASKPVVSINWQFLMQTRVEVIQAHQDIPGYLLMPEAHALIESELNLTHKLAMEMLFILGARVSEMLLLTPQHFVFGQNVCYVNMPTLKKRSNGSRARKRKRLNDAEPLGKLPLRHVPITDQKFIKRLQSHIVTNQIPPSRRFFSVTRRTINRWIEETVKNYEAINGPLPVNITPHTLRHSFGVNAILHLTPIKILQNWMGHSNQTNTEIYTRVLFSDSFEFSNRIVWRPSVGEY